MAGGGRYPAALADEPQPDSEKKKKKANKVFPRCLSLLKRKGKKRKADQQPEICSGSKKKKKKNKKKKLESTAKLINQCKIIYWWDIENCKVPKNVRGILETLKRRLKVEGFTGQLEVHVVVPFLDCKIPPELEQNPEITVHRVLKQNRPTLSEAKSDPEKKRLRKNNQIADGYIIANIEQWLSTEPSHHNMLMSSGDKGFFDILDRLAREGHTTILAYNEKSVSPKLIEIAHYSSTWRAFLFLLPKRTKGQAINEELEEKQMSLLEQSILVFRKVEKEKKREGEIVIGEVKAEDEETEKQKGKKRKGKEKVEDEDEEEDDKAFNKRVCRESKRQREKNSFNEDRKHRGEGGSSTGV